MYQRELENLGMSEKEAKVYLAALDIGPETAQNLAKKSGINRATTYVQIESLKSRGLMTEFTKGKKTFYVAESPERLTSQFKKLETELELKKAELNRVMPALLDKFEGMGERPKVRFFEGAEGMTIMREDFNKIKEKKIYAFTNIDKTLEFSPKFEQEYIRERVQRGIEIDVIHTSKHGPSEVLTKPGNLRRTKFLPLAEFPLYADFTIYDNKVVIEGYKYKSKLIGVIIESEEVAGAMRAIFKNLWQRIE